MLIFSLFFLFSYCNNSIKLGGRGVFKIRPSREGAYLKVRKICCKGPEKRLEVLQIELDKMTMKLNYMKLDIGVIMPKIL